MHPRRKQPRRRPLVEFRVVVDGHIFGPGPDLASYLRAARRRYPKAVPRVEMVRFNAVAVFRIE
jgi:hypothetical protein